MVWKLFAFRRNYTLNFDPSPPNTSGMQYATLLQLGAAARSHSFMSATQSWGLTTDSLQCTIVLSYGRWGIINIYRLMMGLSKYNHCKLRSIGTFIVKNYKTVKNILGDGFYLIFLIMAFLKEIVWSICKAETEGKTESFSLLGQEWGGPTMGAGNSVWVFHSGDRNPISWAITCCLPRSAWPASRSEILWYRMQVS